MRRVADCVGPSALFVRWYLFVVILGLGFRVWDFGVRVWLGFRDIEGGRDGGKDRGRAGGNDPERQGERERKGEGKREMGGRERDRTSMCV